MQRCYTRRLDEGLTRATVQRLHGVLHQSLEDALRLGLVQRTVTERARGATRRERAGMTTGEGGRNRTPNP